MPNNASPSVGLPRTLPRPHLPPHLLLHLPNRLLHSPLDLLLRIPLRLPHDRIRLPPGLLDLPCRHIFSSHRSAPKRQAVLEGLLAGKTVRGIAVEMKISVGAVKGHLHLLCRQERVANRLELVRAMGAKAALPHNCRERAAERRRRVVELMREGFCNEEIRSRLSISVNELWRDIAWLYRRHGIKGVRGEAGRRALAEKLGVPCPESRGDKIRRRVAELRGAGLTWGEVGRAVGLSLGGAFHYARYLAPPAQQPAVTP